MGDGNYYSVPIGETYLTSELLKDDTKRNLRNGIYLTVASMEYPSIVMGVTAINVMPEIVKEYQNYKQTGDFDIKNMATNTIDLISSFVTNVFKSAILNAIKYNINNKEGIIKKPTNKKEGKK